MQGRNNGNLTTRNEEVAPGWAVNRSTEGEFGLAGRTYQPKKEGIVLVDRENHIRNSSSEVTLTTVQIYLPMFVS